MHFFKIFSRHLHVCPVYPRFRPYYIIAKFHHKKDNLSMKNSSLKMKISSCVRRVVSLLIKIKLQSASPHQYRSPLSLTLYQGQ